MSEHFIDYKPLLPSTALSLLCRELRHPEHRINSLMDGVIGSDETDGERRLANFAGEFLFECLLETEELFVYVLVPLFCLAAVFILGAGVYGLIFDPSRGDVASRLAVLSIDPDKWFPRS